MKYSIGMLVALSCFWTTYSQAQQLSEYEKALEAYQQQDFEAAYIHLKNSLKSSPDNLPSKILMGNILLQNGYIADAELELVEALEQGADPNLVVESLAKALLLQDKFEQLLQTKIRGTLEHQAYVEWEISSAIARRNLGQTSQASAALHKLQNIEPNNPRILNSLASIAIEQGQLEAAEGYISQSLKNDAANSRTQHLFAKLAIARQDHRLAIARLQKALDIAPDDPFAKRTLAGLLLKTGQKQQAQQWVEGILEQTPNDPIAMLLQAWLLADANNNTESVRILEELSDRITLAEDSSSVNRALLRYIGAISAFAQHNYEKARKDLGEYVELNPDNADAIALLADIQVRLGKPNDAIQLLENKAPAIAQHPRLAFKLADLYLQHNKLYKAEVLLEQLQRLHMDKGAIVLRQVKLLAARDKPQEALSELNNAFGDSASAPVLLTKALIHMDLAEHEQALAISDRLLQQRPGDSSFLSLRTATLIKLSRWQEALEMSDTILATEPENYSASFNKSTALAGLGQFEQALAILFKLQEQQPNDAQTWILQARILEDQQQLTQAQTSLQHALLIRESKPAREQLARIYQRLGDYDKALLEYDRLLKNHFLDANYLAKKANLYLLKEDFEAARETLNTLFGLWADNPSQLLFLVRQQQRVGDHTGAQRSLSKALELEPGSRLLQLEQVRLWIDTSNWQQAEALLVKLGSGNPTDANVKLLGGDLALAREQNAEAQKFYLTALQMDASFTQAMFKAYDMARRGWLKDQFTAVMEAILSEQPQAYLPKHLLADHYLNHQQDAKAKVLYTQLLDYSELPRRAEILNNLANLLLESEPRKALAFAIEAQQLKPGSAEIADTHGWLLAKIGDYQQALAVLRNAFAMNATNPSIRYHLAYTLAKLGRNQEAAQELRPLLTNELSFAELDAAKALYANLTS